ncbi:hypothetical protein HRG_009714 [Hirsutella rhossiliensis]|uniref:Cyclin N-terminal domain-containing protein n=1 Tax=Hirsutella rhossiliensis TaxID=111463 RepID=A0A9P8SDY7_9HYPO|nr:uncharacterized protein HRG_09714 [Hirsutella rhossiliensis]KAH0959253.1 hypothetical protein HRG_09714 [Hirsutella rhossiliensis]
MISAVELDNDHVEALRRLAYEPVSRSMVAHLARVTSRVINQTIPVLLTATEQRQQQHAPLVATEAALPSLETFIGCLATASRVTTLPLLATLVYLARAKSKLKQTVRGLPSAPHRIFLASLILSTKYLEDCPPKNKRWVRYSRVDTESTMTHFTLKDVNVMEKQLIDILGWDLTISEQEFREISQDGRSKRKVRIEDDFAMVILLVSVFEDKDQENIIPLNSSVMSKT